MQAITGGEMREIDRRTIEEAGIPGEILMERAGIGVARALDRIISMRMLPLARSRTAIWMITGRGNNGGDAFVAARHLYGWGYQVRLLLAAGAGEPQGDALLHLRRMRDLGIIPQEMPRPENWRDFNPDNYPELPAPAIIVDGLLGTGIRGAPRDTMAAAINFINDRRHAARIVAIDVPSGLNADDGSAPGAAVRADITLTMAYPKTGLLQARALEYVGSLEVLDIGIPAKFEPQRSGGLELITPADIRFLGQRRERSAHKGSCGHLAIIAGAPGFSGAAIMTAYGALRSGVGLVSILAPPSVRAEIAGAVPPAMVQGLPADAAGKLAESAWSTVLDSIKGVTALLAGPGITADEGLAPLLEDLLRRATVPLILDADALNLMAHHLSILGAYLDRPADRPPLVITPHPGEMARLLQTTADQVQADRPAAIRRAVEMTGGIVILKGAGTLVAAPQVPTMVNLTGNPGMATGGSGDVLAGLLAGIIASGTAPYQAAQAAVYWHGLAGDYAARRKTEMAMNAGDIIQSLPRALADLTAV